MRIQKPMPESPDSLAEAAKQIGCSPSTIRRWVREGAPTVSLGGAGRGNGSMVDVRALQRWRAGAEGCAADPEILQRLAASLWDVFKRDGGVDDDRARPAHLAFGISDTQAASYLWAIFDRCARDWTGRVPDPLPSEIKTIAALALQTARK